MNEKQIEKYKHIIQNIIDSNAKFYGFENKVEWEFFDNSDRAIVGKVGSNLKLFININSVIYSYEINEPLQIEYFILHEIRHIYQKRLILLYKTDITHCPSPELAQKYNYEFNHYIKPENLEEYYSQQIEFEAFTFSYAVMLYKYGQVEYIKLPEYLESVGIQKCIDSGLNIFKEQHL